MPSDRCGKVMGAAQLGCHALRNTAVADGYCVNGSEQGGRAPFCISQSNVWLGFHSAGRRPGVPAQPPLLMMSWQCAHVPMAPNCDTLRHSFLKHVDTCGCRVSTQHISVLPPAALNFIIAAAPSALAGNGHLTYLLQLQDAVPTGVHLLQAFDEMLRCIVEEESSHQ